MVSYITTILHAQQFYSEQMFQRLPKIYEIKNKRVNLGLGAYVICFIGKTRNHFEHTILKYILIRDGIHKFVEQVGIFVLTLILADLPTLY